MMRIGILGGTFNPVHAGHLIMAEAAREQLKLDKVIFIPSNLPPHKSGKNIASARHRFHMLKLAIGPNPGFEISDYEIEKPGKSYSIDTVNHFKDSFPKKTGLFFIIGSDLIPALHTWKRVEEIAKIATFVGVRRPGLKVGKSRIKVKLIDTPGLETSSSYVRQRIASGKSVRYLVPDGVIRYIDAKGLYR